MYIWPTNTRLVQLGLEKGRIVKKRALTILCAACLASGMAGSLHASGLVQTNPARKAPAYINSPGDFNEYPWFSYDGKLMFWTREKPAGSPQVIYVAYIKNWNQIANTGPGLTLPRLKTGPEDKFDDIQFWIEGDPLFEPGAEVRAYSLCTKPANRAPRSEVNQWVYTFTLYFSVRKPLNSAAFGRLYRSVDIEVAVNKSTFRADILTSLDAASFSQVVPPTSNTYNETEPFFSRDSRYFFWGSNEWRLGDVAEYIGPRSQCTQANQAQVEYPNLPRTGPGDYFAWRDQFNGPDGTRSTNYHTLVTMHTGRTALIFDQCQGQKRPSARDGWCQANNGRLSTTGFTANNDPTNIDDSGWGVNAIHGSPARRATHPAISGGQLGDGRWLLFYMRDRNIHYTKIEIVPDG